ncbi:hypothetical protein GGF32_006941, partial [Allomyces javanicus]
SPAMFAGFPPKALPKLAWLDIQSEEIEVATVPQFSLAKIEYLRVATASLPLLSLASRLPLLNEFHTQVKSEPNDVLDVEYHDDRPVFWESVICFDWWLTAARIPRLKRGIFGFGPLPDADDDCVRVPPMVWPEMEELSFDAESGSCISLSGVVLDKMPRLRWLHLPAVLIKWINCVPLLRSVTDLEVSPAMFAGFPPKALPKLAWLDIQSEEIEVATVPQFSLAKIEYLRVATASLPLLSLASRLPLLNEFHTQVKSEPNDVLDVEYHDDRPVFWESVICFDW